MPLKCIIAAEVEDVQTSRILLTLPVKFRCPSHHTTTAPILSLTLGFSHLQICLSKARIVIKGMCTLRLETQVRLSENNFEDLSNVEWAIL